jgi:hypothetical protein
MMKKVTKTQVRKMFSKSLDQTVSLFPSNCGPQNTTWVQGMEYNPSKYGISYKDLDRHFDKFVNEFQYYNCNNELGKRVHFYINE